MTNEIPEPGLEAFVGEFLEDREKDLILVKQYLEQSDFENLRSYGHKWKGYSSPYGFGSLERFAKLLEKAAEENNKEDCHKVLENIQEYLKIKREKLES